MKDTYKTVCNKCLKKTYYETEQPCHVSGCTGTLKVIDNSLLDPRLTPYYESGQRIEVTYKWGEKARFYVGKSTGWKPIYLEIARSDSSGGPAVCSGDAITDIKPVGKSRR